MADVKWIKITTDIFDDEKILLIESMPEADSIIVIWFKLLALAGKQNNDGVFVMNNRIAYTDEMLATIFRRNLSTVRLALKTFESFGMVEIVEGVITIPNWNKHQSLDRLEAKRERDRLYQAERRAKQKLLAGEKDGVTRLSEDGVTRLSEDGVTRLSDEHRLLEGEGEGEGEGDKKEIYGEKRKRFSPPTVDEVRAYCLERGNSVDPQRFIDHYESNGWMVGKNKMKDWKAAVRTWERSSYGNGREKRPKVQAHKPVPTVEQVMEQYKVDRELAENMIRLGKY